jgi:hypothetical protein
LLLAKIKYISPTDITGSRYTASVKEGTFRVSATVPSTYATDSKDEIRAVEALVAKLKKAPHKMFSYGVNPEIRILGSYDHEVFASIFPLRKLEGEASDD